MGILSKNDIKTFLYSFRPLRRVAYLFEGLGNRRFSAVELETTSACNRECAYCPVSVQRRPARMMEEALFRKIVGDLEAIGFDGQLFFCFYSEPLLDKRLPEFLRYARQRLPKATLEIYTNGDLLTYEKFVSLVQAGADYIKVSLHEHPLPASFAAVLETVKLSPHARHLVLFERHEDQELFNRGGAVYVKNHIRINFCNYKRLTIDVDGNVLLCCMDYYSRHTFGNAAKEPLLAIWNRREYRDVRRSARAGLWPYEICRICSGDAESSPASGEPPLP